jgi:kynurenine formamidase
MDGPGNNDGPGKNDGPGNWSRWGADDERGAANLIDQAAVLRGIAAVRDGITYNLGIPVNAKGPVMHPRTPPMHFMTATGGDYAALGQDAGYADDYLMLYTHGSSHIDALGHVWAGGSMYNGFPMTDVRSSGAARCGIEKLGSVTTRAHLTSFAGQPTERAGIIGGADLDRILTGRPAAVEPGDALLVHTGWMDTWMASRTDDQTAPVLDLTAAEWVAEHEVALVGADNMAVEKAGEDALHMRLIRELGVYLCELLSLTGPVAAGVTTGLLVVAPLQITRGAGSPVNPVLIC